MRQARVGRGRVFVGAVANDEAAADREPGLVGERGAARVLRDEPQRIGMARRRRQRVEHECVAGSKAMARRPASLRRFVSRASATSASAASGSTVNGVRRLSSAAEIVETAPFGSDRFFALAKVGGYDILCHHAAQVATIPASISTLRALAQNTANLRAVLETLRNGGLKGAILTGSVFEQNEGAGEAPLVAFSPYGLSKGLTADVFRHRCREAGVRYAKFVIPNPFGPLEEPRFCAYLIRAWKKGEVARVNTPLYVRDNIHVSLLAAAYVKFAGEIASGACRDRLSPSGYVEAQGAFAERFAAAMRPRSRWNASSNLASRPISPSR